MKGRLPMQEYLARTQRSQIKEQQAAVTKVAKHHLYAMRRMECASSGSLEELNVAKITYAFPVVAMGSVAAAV
tara:strand:+ start:221 stop:439 length:219 start_codon:yes stop_codon:yes gene_type:complete